MNENKKNSTDQLLGAELKKKVKSVRKKRGKQDSVMSQDTTVSVSEKN